MDANSFSLLIASAAIYLAFAGFVIQKIIDYGTCYSCKQVYKVSQDDVVSVDSTNAKTVAQSIVALNSFELVRRNIKKLKCRRHLTVVRIDCITYFGIK